MRKRKTFSAVLTLFLLVPASITWAQTITQEKGLTTAVFTVNGGTLKVYLPDDIRQGDIISGTVVAEPEGRNENQLQKNRELLSRYAFVLNGQRLLLTKTEKSSSFTTTPILSPDCTVGLLADNSNIPLQQQAIPRKSLSEQRPAPLQCQLPGHVLAGSPMTVPGPFDGNAATTQCTIGNQPASILAESPRNCIIAFPSNVNGLQATEVKENGQQTCVKNISSVQMNVAAGKLNLRRGEQTTINVTISGLQGLPDTAILSLVNLSADVVLLQPSNTVMIPLAPGEVSSGNFSRQFDVQSLRTGNFFVNVNLDLPGVMLSPQPGEYNTPQNAIVVKGPKCECVVMASVKLVRQEEDIITFMALPSADCRGPECAYANTIRFTWKVVAGKESAEIVETDESGHTLKVKWKNTNGVTIKNTATVTCSDGTSCTDDVFFNEHGEEVEEVINKDDAKSHTESQTGDGQSKKCKCDGKVKIIPTSDRGSELDFKAEITAECTGVWGKGVNSFSVCGVLKKIIKWTIKDGKDEGEIKGAADKEDVTVSRKTNKAFTLAVKLTVECSDHTICEAEAEVLIPEIPLIEKALCGFSIRHDDPTTMNGGLLAGYQVKGKKIKRDEFVPLGAEGKDYDRVTLVCEPEDPCKDKKDTKQFVLNGRIRFEWFILKGSGSFTTVGSFPEFSSASGDQVIFKPPVLPFPANGKDTLTVTEILLNVIDDNPGQPQDAKLDRIISITTQRKKSNPDYYYIDVVRKESYTLPKPPAVSVTPGTCKLPAKPWSPGDDLKQPILKLPDYAIDNKLVNGEWVIIRVDNKEDQDKLQASCSSSSNPPCTTSGGVNRKYGDNIAYNWIVTEGEGRFITGNSYMMNGSMVAKTNSNTVVETGGYVLYEAPKDLKGRDSLVVTIRCKVSNPEGGVRNDISKTDQVEAGTIELIIHQGGIKIIPAELTWLPQPGKDITLTSYLVYKSNSNGITVWKPAPEHFRRIHFFDLTGISNEPGICMNDPLPDKAKKARDLLLKEEKGKEVYEEGDLKLVPENKAHFLKAKTIAPLNQSGIKVYSEDYGSYGFLRTYANTFLEDKLALDGANSVYGTEAEYTSVPVTISDVLHPSKAMGRGNYDYTDNRVSIPLDIDNNHIADNGWMTAGENAIPDPPWGNEDTDEQPAGDKFNGDGLSNYEEYRGFMTRKMVDEKTKTEVVPLAKDIHVRTDHGIKTIFIHNKHDLPINRYASITGLEVFEISEQQYQGNAKRVVNFNYEPMSPIHLVDQKGLYLHDGGANDKLMGIANTVPGGPARPNDVKDVAIYKDKVREEVNDINKKVDEFNADLEKRKKVEGGFKYLDFDEKLKAVVAHELLHANNVCHHGEGNEKLDVSHDAMNGLRSGDLSCVMRYDNTGTKIKDTTHFPEKPGTALCTSLEGTGYNAPVLIKDGKKDEKAEERGYGNSSPGRGNCAGQIRISGVGVIPPTCPKPK